LQLPKHRGCQNPDRRNPEGAGDPYDIEGAENLFQVIGDSEDREPDTESPESRYEPGIGISLMQVSGDFSFVGD
jgi:hypothetical protein